MSSRPALLTQAEPVVYFVRIGRFIKIGTSANLKSRLSAFKNSAPDVEVLLTVPGGRDLEQRIHALLSEVRHERELFVRDFRIDTFIDTYQHAGLDRAIENLEQISPAMRRAKKDVDRGARLAEARRSKADKDTYFASLVMQRKQKFGW